MVAVRGIGEYAGGRGFTEFAEADPHRTLRQLGEDFAGGNGDAHSAGRGLFYFAFKGFGKFEDNRAQGDLDGVVVCRAAVGGFGIGTRWGGRAGRFMLFDGSRG
jgi:hypothetical protein